METEQKLSAGRYESSILDSNGFEVITVNEIAILDNYRERLGVDHWAISPKASRGLADSEIRDLRDKVVLSVNSHDGMLRALKAAENGAVKIVRLAEAYMAQGKEWSRIDANAIIAEMYAAAAYVSEVRDAIAAAEGRNG